MLPSISQLSQGLMVYPFCQQSTLEKQNECTHLYMQKNTYLCMQKCTKCSCSGTSVPSTPATHINTAVLYPMAAFIWLLAQLTKMEHVKENHVSHTKLLQVSLPEQKHLLRRYLWAPEVLENLVFIPVAPVHVVIHAITRAAQL